jgi:7,8-dihydropterin-6-yl-methyl-4-(beta-D-ribofuranosyl)aminobenzene 5'-phosphate synthase
VRSWVSRAAVLVAYAGALGALLYTLGVAPRAPEKGAGGEPREHAERVRLVVLVDNNPYREGLEAAWGLSVYVEAGGARLLFDTGPDPGVLERNAGKLEVDLSKVDFVVVSHAHGDHTGGLRLLSSIKPGLRVYIPPDQSLKRYVEGLGLEPVQVNSTVEVAEGVFVVKPLYGPPLEDALAIRTSRGLIILVGCSHPGSRTSLSGRPGTWGEAAHRARRVLHAWGVPPGGPGGRFAAGGDGGREDLPDTLQRRHGQELPREQPQGQVRRRWSRARAGHTGVAGRPRSREAPRQQRRDDARHKKFPGKLSARPSILFP